jgi:uncharacterized protein (DUF305 family)
MSPLRRSSIDHEPDDFDIRFIDAMTKHHRDGNKMARMALRKAEHLRLRASAQKMISDHNREIAKLQGWREKWAGRARRNDPQSMPGMMPESEMRAMGETLKKAAGAEFDVMFTDMMATHHQGAITMGRAALRQAKEPKLARFGESVVRKQTREKERLSKWHEQWRGTGPRSRSRSAKKK